MPNPKEDIVIEYIANNPQGSSKDIHEGLSLSVSYATVKRILNKLVNDNLVAAGGKGKSTRYSISAVYKLLHHYDIDQYYKKELDDRQIIENFNFDLIRETLKRNSLFNQNELNKLSELQNKYINNISNLSEAEYKKELERLAIDLSWKSSQIEGNTYTLLETEKLLKEKETAAGKTREEASMLLNHKDAIDFITDHPEYLEPLTISKIEGIHSILIKELNIDRNIRKRRIGISGTNYKPLDNEFQINEALTQMCQLINGKENVFEKALLALVLISYIQPFSDGNKRTVRIVSNAILINNNHCPISFRTVNSIDYKKAMLLFYEQNNISEIKNIFIEQFEFAVNTYF